MSRVIKTNRQLRRAMKNLRKGRHSHNPRRKLHTMKRILLLALTLHLIASCNTTRTVNADGSVTETKTMDPALREAATASAVAISAAVTARVVSELNKPSK